MLWTAWSDGWFEGLEAPVRCVLGRSGVISAALKREGDGATPLGVWPVREAWAREDRGGAPPTALPLRAIGPQDGWSDDPEDPLYNCPVRLPHPFRHEIMRRDDGLYDRLVVLGFNDEPPRPGAGSAIFLHCARPDGAPTEGCVALARADLDRLLRRMAPGDALAVRDAAERPRARLEPAALA